MIVELMVLSATDYQVEAFDIRLEVRRPPPSRRCDTLFRKGYVLIPLR